MKTTIRIYQKHLEETKRLLKAMNIKVVDERFGYMSSKDENHRFGYLLTITGMPWKLKKVYKIIPSEYIGYFWGSI